MPLTMTTLLSHRTHKNIVNHIEHHLTNIFCLFPMWLQLAARRRRTQTRMDPTPRPHT